MDLGDTLDLGQFACETVNVSLSTVNLDNMSDFAPAIEITVYGGGYMAIELTCILCTTTMCKVQLCDIVESYAHFSMYTFPSIIEL